MKMEIFPIIYKSGSNVYPELNDIISIIMYHIESMIPARNTRNKPEPPKHGWFWLVSSFTRFIQNEPELSKM